MKISNLSKKQNRHIHFIYISYLIIKNIYKEQTTHFLKTKLNLQTLNYETDQNLNDYSISQIKQKLEILLVKEIKFINKNDFSKNPY